MRIQIASDLHLEAIPTVPRVEFRRHLESGALRVVERSARRPLPLPEAFKPVRDRDVLVLAGDIGREALALEWRWLAGEHRDLHL